MSINNNLFVTNRTKIANTIKILMYKEDAELLEKLDFDNESLFLEPLLFAYFNTKKENNYSHTLLKEIVQGSFFQKNIIKTKFSLNQDDIAYIPQIGYFKCNEESPFEDIKVIDGTNIEIIKYLPKVLENVFKDFFDNLINENEILINDLLLKNSITPLTNAFNFIKKCLPEHFSIIEDNCKKCLVFKANPKLTNSFATINAHGIAFFNFYQKDYDEVFFVDDIAHQTGHIILTTLCFERKIIFIIDENQKIDQILKIEDYRDIYILFHALYTYYTTFLCLDNCIDAGFFNDKQVLEASARIGFYIQKCEIDIIYFSKINDFFGGVEYTLTNNGILLYTKIVSEYNRIQSKWKPIVFNYKYRNQEYNFALSKFLEIN